MKFELLIKERLLLAAGEAGKFLIYSDALLLCFGESRTHMMIILRIIMNALPEKQKEVMQTLLSMVEATAKERGCLSYEAFCDIRDKNVFSLIEEWETREYLQDHLKSDKFGVLLGTKSLLREPLKVQIQTVSHLEEMEAVKAARINKPPFHHAGTARSDTL
jgi:quinol monooxygenase YgiN